MLFSTLILIIVGVNLVTKYSSEMYVVFCFMVLVMNLIWKLKKREFCYRQDT